jgi:hypothetical protein
MTYPFVQLPTFAEFIGRLTSKEFGCSFETVDNPMTDGYGECHSIHFLRRLIDGEERTYAIYIEDFGERISFSLLRSVCARLSIDSSAFGLTLG